MTWLGIDPGLDGALAMIGAGGEIWHLGPMPVIGSRGTKRVLDEQGLADLLRRLAVNPPRLALVEHAQSLPRQSSVSGFKQGATWGATKMALAAIGLRYEVIRPQAWRAAVGLTSCGSGTSGDVQRQRKVASIARAQALFPGVDLVLPGCRVAHDGLAEALLLAECARRRDLGAA